MILAAGLIGRKVWDIRSGKISIETLEKDNWTHLSIESLRNQLMELLRFSIHHFVLFMLKSWIIVAYKTKQADKKIREKLMHLIRKNAHLPSAGKPSRFLKNIKAHKDQMVGSIRKEIVDSPKV